MAECNTLHMSVMFKFCLIPDIKPEVVEAGFTFYTIYQGNWRIIVFVIKIMTNLIHILLRMLRFYEKNVTKVKKNFDCVKKKFYAMQKIDLALYQLKCQTL